MKFPQDLPKPLNERWFETFKIGITDKDTFYIVFFSDFILYESPIDDWIEFLQQLREKYSSNEEFIQFHWTSIQNYQSIKKLHEKEKQRKPSGRLLYR